MGLEAKCMARINGSAREGVLLLESDHLYFRADPRLKIKLAQVTSIEVRRGQLHVVWAGGEAAFHLGAEIAAKWLHQIQNPKTVIGKLGVKHGQSVYVVGVEDARFAEDLACVVPDYKRSGTPRAADVIFLGIENEADLDKILVLAHCIQPAGALWTIYPKGRKHITQGHVMKSGRDAELVDVKVVGFSTTHTALKWMLPKTKRDAS